MTRSGSPPRAATRADGSLLDSFNQHRDALKLYLVKRLRCAETAEDLTQETWLKANQSDESAAAIANPRAYLFTMAANLATDYLRSQSRRARLLDDHLDYLWGDIDGLTPERYVIAQDELEHISGAIGALRPVSRKIFYLNRFSGMTNRQIADMLGISTGTVAYHIKLVLDHLARARDEFSAR